MKIKYIQWNGINGKVARLGRQYFANQLEYQIIQVLNYEFNNCIFNSFLFDQ